MSSCVATATCHADAIIKAKGYTNLAIGMTVSCVTLRICSMHTFPNTRRDTFIFLFIVSDGSHYRVCASQRPARLSAQRCGKRRCDG